MSRTKNVPSFETLEARTLMAGTVIAAVSSGNLTITGDANDNDVLVTKAGTTVTVTGRSGTIVNQTGDLTNVTGTITIKMVDGNDVVEVGESDSQFRVESPATIPNSKDFSVDMGAGDDDLTIYGLIAKNVKIVSGTGTNNTVIDGADDGSIISGTLGVTGGAGDDALEITGNVVVTKACTISNAAGTNDTSFTDDGTNAPVFAKTLAITGGVDSDTVTIDVSDAGNPLFVNGALTLSMGAGNNEFNVDELEAQSLTYTGGAGDDSINPGGTAGGDYMEFHKFLTLNLAAGTNEANLEDVTTWGGNFLYTGGTTGDTISIDDADIHGAMTMNVGAGTNDLTVDYAEVSGAMGYTGGAGSDSFTVNDEIIVAGATTVTMAAGQNTVFVNSASVKGNLTYNGGANVDDVSLSDTHVNGITKITALAADDIVMIDVNCDFVGAFTLDVGAGDDTVDIASSGDADSGSTSFFDVTNILGGDGNDTVTIGDIRNSGDAVHFLDEKTKFDGGAGLNDVLTNVDVLYSFTPTWPNFETHP